MAATDISLAQRGHATVQIFQRRRMISFGLLLAVLAYLTYVFFAFNVPGLVERARMDNAAILVRDVYSYKTHVTRDNRTGGLSVAIEGEQKGTYPKGMLPDWVATADGITDITLPDGHSVRFAPEAVVYAHPGFGQITVIPSRSGIELRLPQGQDLPAWINASKTRVAITTDAGRLTVTKARTEVFRYAFGWELFFFTLDSPFYGKSAAELLGLALSGDQLRPGQSNLAAMAQDIWTNKMWRHGDVAWAIFETILMAFLGTMGAALISLPLAFLAAANFAPLSSVRFAMRRIFDFVRGVDGLIWTIILSRAFGPGPMTGALAILITDTGSFGKMFSEALENVDDKQIEGVASTGAKTSQRYRFGVIPQITPVLLSQVLYYLESNTRSATVIGAITGGGIGLLLTQAIITQKDWEEVGYYITLVILMVMAMDSLSGWLRNKLIKGE